MPQCHQFKQNVSTEKIQAARDLLEELKKHGGTAAAATAAGPGPAASIENMPHLVGALERLVEAYIELAMVSLFACSLARVFALSTLL